MPPLWKPAVVPVTFWIWMESLPGNGFLISGVTGNDCWGGGVAGAAWARPSKRPWRRTRTASAFIGRFPLLFVMLSTRREAARHFIGSQEDVSFTQARLLREPL